MGHAVCQRLRRRGVIIRPIGDTLILMPAPAMPVELLRTLVEAVGAELALLTA
jgi:adenosylmethionine-8-amino-7-oxononanoate aminotransferase